MNIPAKVNPNPDDAAVTSAFDDYVKICEDRSRILGEKIDRIEELRDQILSVANEIRSEYRSTYLEG